MVKIKIPSSGRIFSAIKNNKNIYSFILIFAASLAVLYAASIFFESYIPLFNMKMTAFVLHFVLNMMGIKNTLHTYDLVFASSSLTIVRQCTGIFEVIALSSVIIAYPTAAAKKTLGIIYGVLIIYFFNLARLILLSVLLVHYPAVFDLVHDYILQFTFVFLVIFVFLLWLKKVVRDEKIVKDEKVVKDENVAKNEKIAGSDEDGN